MSLVHHESQLQIASDQQSQPVTDTLTVRVPEERTVYWCPITTRSPSQTSGCLIAVRPPRFHSNICRAWCTGLCKSVLNQPPSKHTRSRDQSFCDHCCDCNFDRAICGNELIGAMTFMSPMALRGLKKMMDLFLTSLAARVKPAILSSLYGYYCLRKNCPINSSTFFFCWEFPVKNHRINSHTNFCCNFLPCFIQNRSLQKAPPCAKTTEVIFVGIFGGNVAVTKLPN